MAAEVRPLDIGPMPYRDMPRRAKTGRYVAVRTYLDLIAGELAALELREAGIATSVVEATSFNPALAASAGGHRLMIDAADVERADHVLRRSERSIDAPDDEPEDAVRCPRCELAYCNHSRPSVRGIASALPIIALLALLAWPLLRLLPKRWRCEMCGHVWKRADEGPKQRTVLAEDPRPVFLLYRGHVGLGVIIGLVFGLIETGAYAATRTPTLLPLWIAAPFVVTLIGVLIGGRVGRYVCSAPGCTGELAPNAEVCASCHGTVAGRVASRAEHFAAAAEVRRELAQAERDVDEKAPIKRRRPSRRAAA